MTISSSPQFAPPESILAKLITPTITLSHFAATMEHSEAALIVRMKKDAILNASGIPSREYIRLDYFSVVAEDSETFIVSLTGKGQIWLARKYPYGCELGSVH